MKFLTILSKSSPPVTNSKTIYIFEGLAKTYIGREITKKQKKNQPQMDNDAKTLRRKVLQMQGKKHTSYNLTMLG